VSKEVINELINLTEAKLTHLKKIYEYSKYQNEAILEENMEKLEEYISKKQVDIDNISRIDTIFNEKFIELKKRNSINKLEDINSEYHSYIKSLKNNISKIDFMLKEIHKIEVENNEKLNVSFSEVKDKLKNIRNGKNANNKYNAYKKSNNSIFIDSKK